MGTDTIPWLDSEVSLAERHVQINKYTSVIIVVNWQYLRPPNTKHPVFFLTFESFFIYTLLSFTYIHFPFLVRINFPSSLLFLWYCIVFPIPHTFHFRFPSLWYEITPSFLIVFTFVHCFIYIYIYICLVFNIIPYHSITRLLLSLSSIFYFP